MALISMMLMVKWIANQLFRIEILEQLVINSISMFL